MKTDMAIRDMMKRSPVIISPKATVQDAAKEMKGEGIGSLIVIDSGKPMGIITESDILKKVVAEGLDSSKILVDDIMTSAIITVKPDTTIEEAIKIMGELGIRRLPVVENDRLVGMTTQKDILQVSPMLLEVAREWASINENEGLSYKQKRIFSGKCEDCGMLSTRLTTVDGRLICESCKETMK
jgi:CBS domain-containing protein